MTRLFCTYYFLLIDLLHMIMSFDIDRWAPMFVEMLLI